MLSLPSVVRNYSQQPFLLYHGELKKLRDNSLEGNFSCLMLSSQNQHALKAQAHRTSTP